MHRLRLLTLCVLAVTWPTSAWAQAGRTKPSRALTNSPRVSSNASDAALATVQGNALNWNNRAVPDSLVRLRDARYGRIVGTQVTDKGGVFVFQRVEPGAYIVELTANDQTVLAASGLLSASSGDVISAIVKLPFRDPTAGGILGQQALAIMSAAAASGVLATRVTGVDASAR